MVWWTLHRLAQIFITKVYQSSRKQHPHVYPHRFTPTFYYTKSNNTTTMSGPKRPATDAFGSSQLVKRAKSDANLGGSSAVAVVNGSGQNGALIQSVCRNLALG